MDKNQNINTLCAVFSTTGFLHLTGVKFRSGKELSAGSFFDKCLKQRLSVTEFEMASDGTTDKKLQVLPLLIRTNLSATMMGDFSARTPLLMTDKLVGGVKGCMGFVYHASTGYHIPNTVLNLDIRTYISNQQRIIVTYRKSKSEDRYSELVYAAKKVDWEKIQFPEKYNYLPRPN